MSAPLPARLVKIAAVLQKVRAESCVDEREFRRVGCYDQFKEKFGVSSTEMDAMLRYLRPRAKADRFEWLEAVSRCRQLSERGLRVAMALFSRMGDERYVWPSQRWMAAHIGYSNNRDVTKGLEQLVEVGAIRKVRNCDLPPDIASKVMGGGRTPRGISYAAVPPDDWLQQVINGPDRAGKNRPVSGSHNLQVEPPPASPDAFPINVSTEPVTVAPSRTVVLSEQQKDLEQPIFILDPAHEASHDAA